MKQKKQSKNYSAPALEKGLDILELLSNSPEGLTQAAIAGKLNKSVNEELYEECKKMGSHIDFVETVYDNVKHPLGYICKKVQYLTGNSQETYSLTDLSQNIVL